MILADHQRYRLGIVISSTPMTFAFYRLRLWNVCTDYCFTKKFCQKNFGRIFQVRFEKGRVFKVHFFNEDQFSLGLVFIGPEIPWTKIKTLLISRNMRCNSSLYAKGNTLISRGTAVFSRFRTQAFSIFLSDKKSLLRMMHAYVCSVPKARIKWREALNLRKLCQLWRLFFSSC